MSILFLDSKNCTSYRPYLGLFFLSNCPKVPLPQTRLKIDFSSWCCLIMQPLHSDFVYSCDHGIRGRVIRGINVDQTVIGSNLGCVLLNFNIAVNH